MRPSRTPRWPCLTTWSDCRSGSSRSRTCSRISTRCSPSEPGGIPRMELVYCVDFGSTFTKGALVDVVDGVLIGSGSHPTTIGSDVLDGWDAIRSQLEPLAGKGNVPVLACSS